MAGRQGGRPREFDAGEVLERAMLVFWEHGYEGASLTTLTGAMGISTASLYASFGNKEELFRQALTRYGEGPGGYMARALEEPTARQVAGAILCGAIRTTAGETGPSGCLTVQGALATGGGGQGARDLLIAWRADGQALVRERLQRAQDEGDLPAKADPAVLARYVTTLAYGIAVQATGGVQRAELEKLAEASLSVWPLV